MCCAKLFFFLDYFYINSRHLTWYESNDTQLHQMLKLRITLLTNFSKDDAWLLYEMVFLLFFHILGVDSLPYTSCEVHWEGKGKEEKVSCLKYNFLDSGKSGILFHYHCFMACGSFYCPFKVMANSILLKFEL